ncbi:MAG: ABC transporter ATP-binding protein, partial [Polyangiales bacterium]
QVRFLVGFGVLNLCNAILAYAITLTLMLQISVKLTFLALMPLPILVLATQRLGRAVHRRSLDSQTQAAALSQVAHESLSRVRVLRAGALEAWAESRFHACNDAVVQANMRLVVLRGIMWPLFASLGALGVLVTLWFGGRMVIEGELSVGRFAAFHAYLAQLTWPTLAFGYLVTVVQRGRASFSRLQGLLQPEGGRASPGAETLPPASSATTLTSVLPPPATITVAAPPRPAATSMNEPPRSAATSLSAPPLLAVEGLHVDIEGRTLLRDLHLQLTAGARVAIVGRAGAGKSLLAAAITGMLPSTRGQIRWQTRAQAGKANAAGPDNSTAPRCILAPQEPFLFSRSIADNIAFGAGPDVDAAAIAAAAARAHVADEIAAMPEAYDTQVGERGVQLSGGQRQRIALARVLLSQPALWVLDDPLSAVDPHTEACILAALWQHRPGVSLIYLSQRLNAAALADHVWLLDQGRLVDSGSHTDLLTRSPLYQRLAQDSHSP